MIGLALFVYRRGNYLKKVLEGIKANKFDKLYIFQDGFTSGIDMDDWKEVSNIINNIDFIDTEIHISDTHKGLARSILDGMNYVFERHEFAIALEDDVVIRKGYKEFMEQCADKYADIDEVVCACGASIGTLIPDDYIYDGFFCTRPNSVAFGTWKENWLEFKEKYAFNPFALRSIYCSEKKKNRIESIGKDIPKMVMDSVKGTIDTWATYWVIYQIDRMAVCIIPTLALAEDIGRQGDGTNTKSKMIRYEGELSRVSKNVYCLPEKIELDDRIIEDNDAIVSFVDDSDRFKFYYSLMTNWIKLLQKGNNINDYFTKRDINSIYVYGTGKAAELLYYEVEKKIKVVGFIVEIKNEEEHFGVPVFGVEDLMLNTAIPIVITPSHDKKYLKHLFKRFNINNEQIWIETVIDDCFK